uniref:Rho-GAP domain-containing protein n=1 Tax=Arcella intermedia TaxID=1963864 RepID=A0A6B2LGC1_9EUKA
MKHPMNRFKDIPIIVSNAVNYLSIHGPKTEGIFRLSGKMQTIEEIKTSYDRGVPIDFQNETEVHAIAGILKLYLRELPDPLLCFSSYKQWIESYCPTDIEGTKHKMKVLLGQLPTINRNILALLMRLCAAITVHSAENKMTFSNLAICLAPNILKAPDESLTLALMDAGTVNGVVAMFIQYYVDFFGEERT